MPLRLTAVNRYPVKSLRGEPMQSAVVEPWGLSGDRRWMLVDAAGDPITAREHPQMLQVRPQILDGGLRISRPGAEALVVDRPDGAALVDIQVWTSAIQAAPADERAHAWFSSLVGEPVRLVYLDDPTRRATNPAYSRPSDRVSFADAYPLLLTTEASLAALNELIAAGPRAHEGPLPMIRFRPSVVVAGSVPWAEDGWRRLRIGDAVFRCVKGCDRCVMTTVNPDTAAKGKEPIATLARHRKWDGKTWFGLNLVPDTPGVRVRVGDEVDVLEAVRAADGPPR